MFFFADMSAAEKINAALNLEELAPRLPPSPPVSRVQWEDYVDSDGEDALRVLVVLPDEVDEFKFDGRSITKLKTAIHESLQKHGIHKFPYIFLAKEADLATKFGAEQDDA